MRVTGSCRSLVDLLRVRTAAQPDGRAYTFLEAGEQEGRSFTWGALATRSLAIAAAAAGRIARGDRVLVMYPPSLEFVPAFLGVVCAGAVAVPAYPPTGGRTDRALSRLRGIVGDAGISVVVGPRALCERAEALGLVAPELRGLDWLVPEEVPDAAALDWRDPECGAGELALLQYTSGSTASPRGVMVSHGNLLHNLAQSAALARHGSESVAVSWLPVNHDMGLIDGVLQPVFSGFPAYLMSPAAFLQRPARWLQAISRYRATHSGAPNFAYDLCVRRVTCDERQALDLSSWRIAYNGSEPVRHATLSAFLQAFGECGFRWEAFRPAYGLAESTLLVASSGPDHALEPMSVSAGALARGIATAGGLDAVPIVPSGVIDGASRVIVVDPCTGCEVADGRIGELWVSSPSVALGYWGRPDDTHTTFGARLADTGEGPFLRTGDLGFLLDKQLFVTGRIKDILIVRGFKHYPQDLELTVESAHLAIRPGGCAAFQLATPGQEASIVVLAETDPRQTVLDSAPGVQHAAIIIAIRRSVADAHGVALAAVALVPAGHLPKTTSGKIQRYRCRDAYNSGSLEVLDEWTAAPRLFERAAS